MAMMHRIAQQSSALLCRSSSNAVMRRRFKSSTSTDQFTKQRLLEADTGPLATHVNHKISQFLAVAAPCMFLVPTSWNDGIVGKGFGVLVATNISIHSWVGLNNVAADYVPKFSKTALGPARYVNAGICACILLGMSKIAVSSPGGIVGCVKGLWNPPKKEEKK